MSQTGTQQKLLNISDSPQYFDRATTKSMISTVIACLIPAAAWGVFAFGVMALAVLVVAMTSAFLSDWLAHRLLGKSVPRDGHALLIGLLIGMTMPPNIPLFIPILASVFSILVIKWPLGGAGGCWVHPAAAGWAFAFVAWPQFMARFSTPRIFSNGLFTGPDSKDPSGAVSSWLINNTPSGLGPSDILTSLSYNRSPIDSSLSDLLNRYVLAPIGAYMPGGYVDALLGFSPGAIGEVSAILLMVGSVFLIAKGITSWHIPATFFGSFAVLTYVFGGLIFGTGLLTGDVLFMILNGSFLLVLFFIATDLSTGPLTFKGRLIAGLLLGIVTFIIQMIGRGGDVALVAVLIVNLMTSWVDRVSRTRKLGSKR